MITTDTGYEYVQKETVFEAKVLGIAETYDEDVHYYLSILNFLSGDVLTEEFAKAILYNKNILIFSIAAKTRMLNNDEGPLDQLLEYDKSKAISFDDVWNKNKFIDKTLINIEDKDLFFCSKPDIYS
jgi:hypothetical protein